MVFQVSGLLGRFLSLEYLKNMILILSNALLYIRALRVKSPQPPAGGGQGYTERGFRGASQ